MSFVKRGRILSITALFLLVGILAVGCSSDGASGGETTTTAQSTEPIPSQTTPDTTDQTISEPTVADDPLLEGDFADNRVLVVMTKAVSLEFRDYGVEDFPEIDALDVTDLSVGKKKKEEISKKENPTPEELEQLNRFRQILCIELAEHSKENVVKVVRLLQKRADVAIAELDYIMYWE